ncbi:acyl-CoA dehydrogenase domain-containing protein, partial [Vibrio nigripulchritudo ATCC 27043]|uniref:acyl-CoA dehydrogenase family protein n=1 Tax=Vibrio nigripulchritudo TaxID=28173 RepID=UPI00021C310B
MDFNLSKEHLALQTKAKEFTEQVLFPHELECEENDGISKETHEEIKKQVVEWGFNAPNHSREDGGQEFSIFEQTLLNEQLGMATGAIWDALWYPSYPMKFASQEQKERYLIPTCQGKRRDAYAITEADAGSDPRQCATRADRVDGGWVINGEKWFVTLGDIADYILVHAHVDGDPDKPTVFFVDKDLPGVEVKRTPLYTHHFAFEHPEFVFKDVFLTDKEMLGEVGQGYELTKDWFVEARLGIAARCVGGAIRAAEEANQFVACRQQFGQPLRDFQAIEFMLADMAVKIMAAKSMLYRLSWEIDQSDDRKMKHARAAALKLHCSEMVGQVCDTALQIMGGRGY